VRHQTFCLSCSACVSPLLSTIQCKRDSCFSSRSRFLIQRPFAFRENYPPSPNISLFTRLAIQPFRFRSGFPHGRSPTEHFLGFFGGSCPLPTLVNLATFSGFSDLEESLYLFPSPFPKVHQRPQRFRQAKINLLYCFCPLFAATVLVRSRLPLISTVLVLPSPYLYNTFSFFLLKRFMERLKSFQGSIFPFRPCSPPPTPCDLVLSKFSFGRFRWLDNPPPSPFSLPTSFPAAHATPWAFPPSHGSQDIILCSHSSHDISYDYLS